MDRGTRPRRTAGRLSQLRPINTAPAATINAFDMLVRGRELSADIDFLADGTVYLVSPAAQDGGGPGPARRWRL